MLEPRPEISTATWVFFIVIRSPSEAGSSAFLESVPVQRIDRRYTGAEEETSAAAATADAKPRRGAVEHSQSYHAMPYPAGAGRGLGDHGGRNECRIYPVPCRRHQRCRGRVSGQALRDGDRARGLSGSTGGQGDACL